MREIKFRAWEPAWHEGTRHMLYPDDDFGCYLEPEGLNGTIDTLQKEGYVLMQYTGLRDKNGKEIYEGDVVRIEWDDFDDDTYVCEWDDEFAGFEFSDKDKEVETFLGGARYKYMEIIGNIYENLELLESK